MFFVFTAEAEELIMKAGDRVTWLHVPRDGYGYSMMVEAEIVALEDEQAIVKVQKKSGEVVLRRVSRGSLRERGKKERGPLCRYCGCPLSGVTEVLSGSGVYDRSCHARDGDMCEGPRV